MTTIEAGLVSALVSVTSVAGGFMWGRNGAVKKAECLKLHASLAELLEQKFENIKNEITIAILQALGKE